MRSLEKFFQILHGEFYIYIYIYFCERERMSVHTNGVGGEEQREKETPH